ncbi:unnamed protein product [Blepharisma stoltei]|uniref:J domain-containing protein n=1 Tax=Blepharisma stoltei TaxID=1481888 RepID=A0AAU9IYK0_9CILI|nr:unnamed protein product [Blepharisma stoltei]
MGFFLFAFAEEDFYKILGINRNADEKTIKRAYKNLCQKYPFPDENSENKVEIDQMFKRIKNAYEVLIDPEKRKNYNVYGDEWNESFGNLAQRLTNKFFTIFYNWWDDNFNFISKFRAEPTNDHKNSHSKASLIVY